MFSSLSLSFLFTLSLLSSVSATSRPCASQPVKAPSSPPPSPVFPPTGNPHFSNSSLHLSLGDLIKSRQAVAPPPIFYKTQKESETLSRTLGLLKGLGWELDDVRDEMGRLASRVRKLDKRQSGAHEESGQEIHDLLHHLLEVIQSPSALIVSRKIHHNDEHFVAKPIKNQHDHRVAGPSASPKPCGSRGKRATLANISTANLKQNLSRVLDSFSSTLNLATASLSSISSPSQQSSIEALIDELRWEMSTLLADTQQDVPGLSLPDGY
ncbi:hypothetical protein JCM5350_007500 [Sporobolomyces pararoseus]